GSHASTLKSPSYTKSVSWQHYHKSPVYISRPTNKFSIY
ncbi:transposase, partial [Escherichia coli]